VLPFCQPGVPLNTPILSLAATSSLPTTGSVHLLLIKELLKEIDDVVPKEDVAFRGIEQQIDLVPGASLPNRSTYITNPDETKEIETQVQDLLDKGCWVQKEPQSLCCSCLVGS